VRVTINPTLDMETLTWVSNDGVYEYHGHVTRYCSSGGQIAATDEALQASQAAFNNTMVAQAGATFAEQQGVLGRETARLNAIMANPMGYTPTQLHNAVTGINENTAAAAKNAIGKAAAFSAAHGGADIGGGTIGAVAGDIASQAAQAKSSQLASLSQQDQELKQQNFWKAMSGLGAVSSEYGGANSTQIGGANSAANSAVGAGKGALDAKQAGWANFGGILSGIGGLASAGTGAYSDIVNA